MDNKAQILVSFEIFLENLILCFRIIDGNVALKANSVNWAAPADEILDGPVDSVGFTLLRNDAEIVVEELDFWVCRVGSFERLADEICNI